MFDQFFHILQEATGWHKIIMTPLLYMIIRGVIIYFLGVLIIRVNKKMFNTRTPFNFLLFLMFGSIFADAIMDEKLFLPTLATIILFVVLNSLITMLTFYFTSVERLLTGEPVIIVKSGEIQWDMMKTHFLTERELLNELNAQLHTNNLAVIEAAILVPNGSIHFIKK